MSNHASGKHTHLTVRPITFDDWRAYRDFYKGLDDPHMFKGFLQGKNLDDEQTWKDLFQQTIGRQSPPFVMFGLWDGDKLVGQSSIDFTVDNDGRVTALLAGSEIAPQYRGHGLVDKFYQARMKYLEDFNGDIITTIKSDNHASIKAAERNGFVHTGEVDRHGYLVFSSGPVRPEAINKASVPEPRPGERGG
ncbi:MAG: GNAT family N-acetyltransferase [Alphaproteobacteria bacterium]|nr:GNAT family N-acetyltransferase [Alphaproteobacteria bacterium]